MADRTDFERIAMPLYQVDEARDPWLDEGLTSYSTARAMDEIYGPGVPITFLARLEKMMLFQVQTKQMHWSTTYRESTRHSGWGSPCQLYSYSFQ